MNREALYTIMQGSGTTDYELYLNTLALLQHDWKEHFRPFWGSLVSEKSRHDPDNVLGPGPGVFA